MLKQISHLAL